MLFRSMIQRTAVLAMVGVAPFSIALLSPSSAVAEIRHTKLLHSSPAADAMLPKSPTSVTLWFSKAVQPKLTRVQLADGGGKAILLNAPLAMDAGDTAVVAGLRGSLPSGSYTVTWATTSRDSHVIKGRYRFRVE